MRQISNKIKGYRKGGALLLIIAAGLLFASKSNVLAIEQTTRPSTSEIKTAIAELAEPLDIEKLSWIHDAIFSQDPKEQEELNKLLDTKREELFKIESLSAEAAELYSDPTESLSQETPSYEELRWQIYSLNLGPDATVEDLRQRDKIVANIAGIQDPIAREEMLKYLEEKEKTPQTQ